MTGWDSGFCRFPELDSIEAGRRQASHQPVPPHRSLDGDEPAHHLFLRYFLIRATAHCRPIAPK